MDIMNHREKILSSITKLLRESKLSESTTIISPRMISSNDTDIKESLVMLFYDCIRSDSNFIKMYSRMVENPPTKEDILKLKQTLKLTKSLGSNYGSVNIDNLHKFVIQVLRSDRKSKTDRDYKLVNNGASSAYKISKDPKISKYIGSKKYATRGDVFEKIRSKAVELFKNIKVELNFPDNWCPGDFYIMDSKNVPNVENIIDLNSHFAGPSYPKGDIIAISLKMETAQAGKGTTFLKTVLSVPDIDPKKVIPTNKDSADGLKYLSAKRLVFKYGIKNAPLDPDKVYLKLATPFKMVYLKTADKLTIPLINQFYSFTNKERDKQKKFIRSNYKKMAKEAVEVFDLLDKKILGKKQTKAYSDGFKDAYSEFTQYIRDMGIKIESAGSDEFIKKIMTSKASKKESGVQNILIKKAECYTRAIELITKWSDKNKEISKPFKKLGSIDNPFLAITMFAIAQHGANPDFFKVHGSDDGLRGTLEVFPAKSKVDKTTIIQTLEIKDSEGQAGFFASYNMKLNNIMYKTTLAFRFSDKSFRVEVQELEERRS